MTSDDNCRILSLLRAIISGRGGDADVARDLVGAMLERFPDADDDARFEQLMFVLACYEPNGGEFLYNGEQLADECRRVLALLEEDAS